MSDATDVRDEWNDTVDGWGDAVTIYDPTITYNDENDVNAYTLDAGTSATIIMLKDPDGITYSSEVEGIDDRLSLRSLIKTTDTVDEETIIKDADGNYYQIAQGSLRIVTVDDTVVTKRAILREMLPQEAAKIA